MNTSWSSFYCCAHSWRLPPRVWCSGDSSLPTVFCTTWTMNTWCCITTGISTTLSRNCTREISSVFWTVCSVGTESVTLRDLLHNMSYWTCLCSTTGMFTTWTAGTASVEVVQTRKRCCSHSVWSFKWTLVVVILSRDICRDLQRFQRSHHCSVKTLLSSTTLFMLISSLHCSPSGTSAHFTGSEASLTITSFMVSSSAFNFNFVVGMTLLRLFWLLCPSGCGSELLCHAPLPCWHCRTAAEPLGSWMWTWRATHSLLPLWEHRCTVGLDRDPPVWHSHPGRMMRVSERQLFVVVVEVIMEVTGGEHEVSVL